MRYNFESRSNFTFTIMKLAIKINISLFNFYQHFNFYANIFHCLSSILFFLKYICLICSKQPMRSRKWRLPLSVPSRRQGKSIMRLSWIQRRWWWRHHMQWADSLNVICLLLSLAINISFILSIHFLPKTVLYGL